VSAVPPGSACCPACAPPARCIWATTRRLCATGFRAAIPVRVLLLRCRLARADDGYEDTAGIPAAIARSDRLAGGGLNPGSQRCSCSRMCRARRTAPAAIDDHPARWLEAVPTYKDQQEQLKRQGPGTYGSWAIRCMQSADILIYRAAFCSRGRGQVAHVRSRARLRAASIISTGARPISS